MKKNYINILLLVITAASFQGCLFPWGFGNGGNSGNSYTVANTDKFIRERNYEKEHPFQMRDEAINVPMISQKGQVNWSTNLIHGVNSSITVGVSNKMFVEAGGTYTRSKNTEQKSANIEYTTYYSNYDNTTSSNTYNSQTYYNLNLALEGYSYNVGAGFYKTFGKKGIWDYHAGFANGNSSSSYAYDIELYNTSGNTQYSFEEKRKYYQFFLQTDFGYETNMTEGAIVARTSWIHFTNQEFHKSLDIPDYQMQSSEFVFQPAFHFAYGNTFKVFTQCGWNIPLGNSQLKWFSTNVQAGIICEI